MRYAPITERMKGLGAEKWDVHYRARAKVLAGERVLQLSIGEPDWPAPAAVLEETIRALRAGRTTYSSGRGEENMVETIAAHYAQRTRRTVSPDSVIFMPGTQAAMCAVMMALVSQGDEVIVPEPFYVTYDGIIAATGATQVPVLMKPEDGFHLTVEELQAVVTEKSRVLVLNSPSNPTGAVLAAGEVAAIGRFCVEHDLWIVSDEVYSTLLYGGVMFASPFDDPVLAQRTAVVSSLSKSHAMTGYRAGWIVGPEELCTRALPIAEAMLFGCQPFIQDAAVYALTHEFAECHEAYAHCERRAQRMSSALAAMPGVTCSMPEGGMFLFADVRETGLSGHDFALRLLEEENVSTMPGESFGRAGAGHVRVSITAPDDVIDEALERIAKFTQSVMAAV